jgi:hypothetical protein
MTAFVVSKHCCVKTDTEPVRGAPGAVIVYKAILSTEPVPPPGRFSVAGGEERLLHCSNSFWQRGDKDNTKDCGGLTLGLLHPAFWLVCMESTERERRG